MRKRRLKYYFWTSALFWFLLFHSTLLPERNRLKSWGGISHKWVGKTAIKIRWDRSRWGLIWDKNVKPFCPLPSDAQDPHSAPLLNRQLFCVAHVSGTLYSDVTHSFPSFKTYLSLPVSYSLGLSLRNWSTLIWSLDFLGSVFVSEGHESPRVCEGI